MRLVTASGCSDTKCTAIALNWCEFLSLRQHNKHRIRGHKQIACPQAHSLVTKIRL